MVPSDETTGLGSFCSPSKKNFSTVIQAPATAPCPVGYAGCVGEPSGNACDKKKLLLFAAWLASTAFEFSTVLLTWPSILPPWPFLMRCTMAPPDSGRWRRWTHHF